MQRRSGSNSRVPNVRGAPSGVFRARVNRSPSAVVRELHKNDGTNTRTTRGRQIAFEMENLMDEVYGGVATQPPPNLSGTGGHYARFKSSFSSGAVPRTWRTGPVDQSGRFFDASDRNLLCMDVHTGNALCVVGSADHGLKVFDITSGREKRNLYTKKYGHTEWVTCCKFFQNSGRIISGGMDSKLCLWEATGPVRCSDILGHTGSISQVEVNNDSEIVISSSYDRTLRLWDCGAGGRCVGTLAGHKAPVMMFSWCGAQVLSGDRQGTAKVWDLETGDCLATMATKRGQIGSVCHLLNTSVGLLSAIGDQGGVVTVIDFPRTGSKPVFQDVLHPGGVVSAIRSIDEKPSLVTAGADKIILVLDPRMNFATLHRLSDHRDFIYSLETFGSFVLSGGGNGWLLVHDSDSGDCCYKLMAGKAAVREIFATPAHLLAAGDDGKAVVYDYM